MSTPTQPASPPEPGAADDEPVGADPVGGLSWTKLAVLGVALAFLGGSIGYLVGHREATADPLNAVDVGFLQDMGVHHSQAVEMAILLIDKDGVDSDLKSYAQEILIGQRFDQGIFNATLDRYGHAIDPGDTVMGWMGPALPRAQMEGLASDAQMAELRAAKGRDAEALWIALMSEHHLGGLHMADEEARHGKDGPTVNLAKAIVVGQRGEVIDLDRYRRMHDLPIPPGFGDPMKDPRLNPLSFTGVTTTTPD